MCWLFSVGRVVLRYAKAVTPPPAGLRRVDVVAATGIGVGSMLGAGVFSDMWADVLAAGRWYWAAILLAGLIALANGLSTAQLAARYPVAGGAYSYGRQELGAVTGHIAGASFLVGKTVSVAVAAAVLGAYVVPGHPQLVATAALCACWALNARGITKTAAGATLIAIVVSLALIVFIFAASATSEGAIEAPGSDTPAGGVSTFLIATATAFFAFAGYARIATLGEDVRQPARTIPRAIIGALAIVLALYLGVAWAMGNVPGTPASTGSPSALLSTATVAAVDIADLASAGGIPTLVVTVVAALAVFGAMLAVMAGAGRTAMAMARNGDMPRALASQGSTGAPWRAEAVVALAALVVVWLPAVNLILVSVTTVLIYYAVANLAAIRQRRAGRTSGLRIPVAVSVMGLVGSALLAAVALVAGLGNVAVTVVILAAVVVWPVGRGMLARCSQLP
jgi:APA family basic amino acid/polyamine antiporter